MGNVAIPAAGAIVGGPVGLAAGAAIVAGAGSGSSGGSGSGSSGSNPDTGAKDTSHGVTHGDKKYRILVLGQRVDAFFGVHHLFLAVADHHYVIFEYMRDSKVKIYGTKWIKGSVCDRLSGTYSLNQLHAAAEKAKPSEKYDRSSNNCNHFVQRMYRHLTGGGLTVHWNCSCILDDSLPWVNNSHYRGGSRDL